MGFRLYELRHNRDMFWFLLTSTFTVKTWSCTPCLVACARVLPTKTFLLAHGRVCLSGSVKIISSLSVSVWLHSAESKRAGQESGQHWKQGLQGKNPRHRYFIGKFNFRQCKYLWKHSTFGRCNFRLVRYFGIGVSIWTCYEIVSL